MSPASNTASQREFVSTSESNFDVEVSPASKFLAPKYKPANKLFGKRALITGGDSGIGRAVAVIYAREGADVAITYLPSERSEAQTTCQAIHREGRKCALIEGDLSDAHFCTEAVQRTLSELGGIDILVSHAAHQMRKTEISEITKHEWEFTFKSNIEAYFLLAKCAIPYMSPGSAIIATISEPEHPRSKNFLDYAATQGAIGAFTRSLAQNLAEKGIRVNAVALGAIGNEPLEVHQNLSRRAAHPDEIAPAYVFLASHADSSCITGVVLPELGATAAFAPHESRNF